MERRAEKARQTAETQVRITLALDGAGRADIDTSCGFLDHMLTLFTLNGRFDVSVHCRGDAHVDYHHITEDCGLTLGQAFASALEGGGGIVRYGEALTPMDEALVMVALDISGRPYFAGGLGLKTARVGLFDAELGDEFFAGLCRGMGLTLHLRRMAGRNCHHVLEAAFKGVGRALGLATAPDSRLGHEIPSTKGVLL